MRPRTIFNKTRRSRNVKKVPIDGTNCTLFFYTVITLHCTYTVYVFTICIYNSILIWFLKFMCFHNFKTAPTLLFFPVLFNVCMFLITPSTAVQNLSLSIYHRNCCFCSFFSIIKNHNL